MAQVSVSCLIMAALVVLVWLPWGASASRFEVQENFTVSIRGDFVQTGCAYCDCLNVNCTWAVNTTCQGATVPVYDASQRWGFCATNCSCFQTSGVTFKGRNSIQMTSNPTGGVGTAIGTFTHFNNPIYGTSPTRLRLSLQITSPQLEQPFVIRYPLYFYETPNSGLSSCDPSLQLSGVDCDDYFAFGNLALFDTFTKNNVEYTLEIIGFLQAGRTVNNFRTEERTSTEAEIYAKIVTACIESSCGPFEVFQPPPTCGCVCGVNDDLCMALNDGNRFFKAVNETCSCECSLSTEVCQNTQGRFYQRATNDTCACECMVTDAICVDIFGKDHTADPDLCTCVGPSGGGLSDGAIAGIAIGAVAGAIGLAALFLAVGGLLTYLIKAGAIPGIYGVRIEAASFEGASESPLYHDPWKSNSNVLN